MKLSRSSSTLEYMSTMYSFTKRPRSPNRDSESRRNLYQVIWLIFGRRFGDQPGVPCRKNSGYSRVFVVAAQDGYLFAHSTGGLPMDVDTARFDGMQVSDIYDSSHLAIGGGMLE